ncbi:MAG: glycosyltransferase family 4 protein [Pirellulaceae bacterium]
MTVHRIVPWWSVKRHADRLDRFVPRMAYRPYQDLKAAWAIRRRWNVENHQQRFDLVQSTNVLAVGWFFRGEKRIPVVTRLSSFRPVWDRAAGIPIDFGTRMRWRMERSVIRRSRYIYSPTAYVAKLSEEAYKVPPIEVIESPYFHESVVSDHAMAERLSAKGPYLLFFGRMTQMKGVHVLAESLVRLLSEIDTMQAVFAGGDGIAPGGGSMKEYLKNRLAPFGARVHILDSMRHESLYPIIERARLVVLPSLMDNLPNSCLEAMAHGAVVVATEGSCFESLIRDRVSGLLARPNDEGSLCRAIREGWTLSEEEREAMSREATRRIQGLYPKDSIPRLERYYQAVVDKHPAKSS